MFPVFNQKPCFPLQPLPTLPVQLSALPILILLAFTCSLLGLHTMGQTDRNYDLLSAQALWYTKVIVQDLQKHIRKIILSYFQSKCFSIYSLECLKVPFVTHLLPHFQLQHFILDNF